VFDCIRLAGEDASDVCATCGITVHEEQIALLSRYKTVYICFDNEFEAKERARKLARKLGSMGVKVFVVDTEMPYDLGATSDEEAKKLKQEILNGC
jgi:DNA primase